MIVLLLFCLPLVFTAHISSFTEKKRYVVAYGLGIVISTVLLALASFSSLSLYRMCDTAAEYWFYHGVLGTTVPFCCIMLIYILFFFKKSTVLETAGFAVFYGFCTVKVYTFLFAGANEGRLRPLVFIIFIYSAAAFIFDSICVLCRNKNISGVLNCLIGTASAFAVCLAGFSGIAEWYFNGNAFIYGSILILIPIVCAVVHFLFSFKMTEQV